MKRIDIALIVSGLAMMALSGAFAWFFSSASWWINLSGLGALQLFFGTAVMALRQFKSVDRKLAETEAN